MCDNQVEIFDHGYLIGSSSGLPNAIAKFVEDARTDIDGDGSRKARRQRLAIRRRSNN